MARPLRIELKGGVYHVTARGNERGTIYSEKRDYEKHLEIIGRNVERYGVKIFAYVLMGNHYHLLIETPDGNISKFMHAVQSHYTIWYNRKHDRVGHLFQGRYKALIVDKESYLLELSRYIHLNPVRAGFTKKPENYQWSSFLAYITGKNCFDWLDTEEILKYYGLRKNKAEARRRYRDFIQEAMGETEVSIPENLAVAQLILGPEEFVEQIKEELQKNPPMASGEYPSMRRIGSWSNKEAAHALKISASCFDTTEPEILTSRKRKKPARNITILLFREHSRWSISEIGDYFGISYSAVPKAVRKAREDIKNNKQLRQVADKIAHELSIHFKT